MPDKFIHIAEETGLIMAIGEWVLYETCRQGRKWLDKGFPSFTLAVDALKIDKSFIGKAVKFLQKCVDAKPIQLFAFTDYSLLKIVH